MPQRKLAEAANAPDKTQSRVDALTRALAAEILDGSRPVGSTLPGEAEIAATHGASAASVRAALRRMEGLGLIARSRGSNARVISGDIRASYLIGPSGPGGLGGAYGGDTRILVERQRQVEADAELAMLLGVREGSMWLHVSGLRHAEDVSFGPLSWVDVWLEADPDALDGESGFTAADIAALTGVPVAEALEEFSAAALTPAQARHLRARGGTASLHVMRRYRRANGGLLAAVRDVHPAERVSVAVRLGA